MKYAFVAIAVLAALICAPSANAADAAAPKTDLPCIEVVFVLDTTGSMGGLIEGAKQKIWAIANTLISAKPAPEIKMGLVGYRDLKDAYVTVITPLTDDLDSIHKDLMAYKAEGGGDGPESVNQALDEALTKMKWTKGADTSHVYRVIFLVGDYPPHMDYKDDVKYPATCKAAVIEDIIINTIQCGSHAPTTKIWTEIAAKAKGEYFRVVQDGGAIITATPFDKKLGDISRELDGTRVWYGDAKLQAAQLARAKSADEFLGDASAPAKADRAEFNAKAGGKKNFLGAQELVNDLADGKMKLADVKKEHLPENMRKMTVAEREKFIKEQTVKRAALQKQVTELAAKRRKHIDEQLRKNAVKGRKGFDLAIYECVRKQGAKKKINYAEPVEPKEEGK